MGPPGPAGVQGQHGLPGPSFGMNEIHAHSLVQYGNENDATPLQIRHNTDTSPCEECINTVGPDGKTYKNYWCENDNACYPHGATAVGSTKLGCPTSANCVAKNGNNCDTAVCTEFSLVHHPLIYRVDPT